MLISVSCQFLLTTRSVALDLLVFQLFDDTPIDSPLIYRSESWWLRKVQAVSLCRWLIRTLLITIWLA